MNDCRVYDLGFAVARLEENENGGPIVTIFAPSSDDLPPQQINVWDEGCAGLVELGNAIRYWKAKHNGAVQAPEKVEDSITNAPLQLSGV